MKAKSAVLHIGQKIEEEAQRQNISKTALGKKINKERSSIYHMYKSKSIDSDLLFEISKALKHNFFQYYVIQLPAELTGGKESKSEIERLKKELEMRDKLIALLEEKGRKK